MRTASRTDSAVELGQWLARQLLETPVKDAVREALEEDRATRQERADPRPGDTDEGATSTPVVPLLAGLAAVGVVAYLLRRHRSSDSDYPTRPSDVDEGTEAGDRMEGAAPVDTDG